MLDPDISTADALAHLLHFENYPGGLYLLLFLLLVGMGMGAGACASTGGSLLNLHLPGIDAWAWAAGPIGPNDGVLVVLGMFGGNDGLNTVVPFTDGNYLTQHGGLALRGNQVLPLDADTGLLPFDGVATLGLGSGRFAEKTERDEFEGLGSDATVVFGGLAWEVSDHVNLIADWNGRNLSVGAGLRIPQTPLSLRLGVRDLTDYTGDGARLTGSVGMTVARF